ncbi:MAG: hypothetical protein HY914_04610 [Desulfomonile tiedjei]|nr:hypothetical protein [Desulfomonile tiedjei]
MEITVTAPNRVDLAGGTTDIYPLYLFMDGGCTVNAAVTIHSRVTIRTHEGSRIRIVSEDLGASVAAPAPAGLPVDGPLGLLGRAVRAVPPPGGMEMVVQNSAPAGSGLGASSALLAAALAGLLHVRGEEQSRREVVDLAANIETAAIAVPAGKQDHIAAVYGGVSRIDFGYRDFHRQDIGSEPQDRLEQMVVLSYTGEGRFSGMNNWEITRAIIDGNGEVKEKLMEIREVARELGSALLEGGWNRIPELVNREWQIRRTLAPGVSTPRIEGMMSAASAAGALASKVCGAGGGGCMITFADPPDRAAVEKAIEGAGGTVLPYRVDRQGLALRQTAE